jgi:hypothetical protein
MNIEYIEILRDHISEPISSMDPGDEIDCEGLIAPEVWTPVPPPERRHAFGIPVARLVAEHKVPLVFVRLDSKRHNVYRRI